MGAVVSFAELLLMVRYILEKTVKEYILYLCNIFQWNHHLWFYYNVLQKITMVSSTSAQSFLDIILWHKIMFRELNV